MCVRRPLGQAGFTLLELMIVVAILGIVAGIGVPQYASALLAARMQKARQELVTIAGAVDIYRGINGALPLTLYQVGFGGKRDPWGVLYCYLNYADGTGDGLEWAIDAGIVDPAALQTETSSAAAAPTAPTGPGRPGTGIPAAPAADALLRTVTTTLSRDVSFNEMQSLQTTFAEVKGIELYATVASNSVRRRDRYMFPLNTDYDLFSLGPNRSTAVSLGQALSQDDVIRANDGGFFGPASEY